MVIADVDTPLAPGAYKGAKDAVEAWGKYQNSHGGLAGRKVVVDFYDSKLAGDETRNAIIAACQKDFVVVGTVPFLNNVDHMVKRCHAKRPEDRPPRLPRGPRCGRPSSRRPGVVPDHRPGQGLSTPTRPARPTRRTPGGTAGT